MTGRKDLGTERGSRRARERAAPDAAWHRRLSRMAGGVAVVVVAMAAIAAIVVLGFGSGSAVTHVGGLSASPLHSFSGDHHAPFISVADYEPIYARKDPNWILVDVREAPERANAHIPGDIWVPLADAATTGWQALLPYKDKMIVLYCDCPWAEAAQESVILEAHGFSDAHLRVLHEGIQGWAAAGYPIVSGGNPCQEHYWPRACGG